MNFVKRFRMHFRSQRNHGNLRRVALWRAFWAAWGRRVYMSPTQRWRLPVLFISLLFLAAATRQATLTRGPFLQNVSDDGVTIVAKTSSSATLTLQPWGLSTTGTTHVYRVNGLDPGTAYQYSLGGVASTFKTAPTTATPFRFLAFGDSGTAGTAQFDCRDRMVALHEGSKPMDFILGLGDLVYESGQASGFDPRLFSVYAPLMREMAFWPTLGNHDVATSNGAPFYEAFYLPTTSGKGGPSDTERYYSFDYGNAHFVCLDSESSSHGPTSAMYQWARADMLADDSTWTIAFMHHPIYSKGSHDSDDESELIALRRDLRPLFDEVDLDLVLVGHSHNYERSFLLRDDAIVTAHPNAYTKPPQGAVYVVSGCAGKTSTSGSMDHPLMATGMEGNAGFSYVEIEGPMLRGFFVNRQGAQTDAFSISKGPATPIEPVASFTAVESGLTVQFTDTSTGTVEQRAWMFGDGQGSSQANPSHTYPSAGAYLVELDVSGSAGSSHVEQTISVEEPAAPSGGGIWISDAELAQLPMSGPEWENLLADSQGSLAGANIGNQSSATDQDCARIFAAALVAARYRVAGDARARAERARVEAAILDAIGSESSASDALAPSRKVCAIVLAADLNGTDIRAWVDQVRTRTFPDGRSITSTHEDRPNNWGTHAGASRLACSIYLRDWPDVERCLYVFAGWLGYRSLYDGFEYGALDWQANANAPVGINPFGATKNGISIDGVLPDDQRRDSCTTFHVPCETNYTYEALQGVVTQAVLFDRLRLPAIWRAKRSAIKRAYVWLRDVNGQALTDSANGSNDWWQAYIVNRVYPALDLSAPQTTNAGRAVGWSEWTAKAPNWP